MRMSAGVECGLGMVLAESPVYSRFVGERPLEVEVRDVAHPLPVREIPLGDPKWAADQVQVHDVLAVLDTLWVEIRVFGECLVVAGRAHPRRPIQQCSTSTSVYIRPSMSMMTSSPSGPTSVCSAQSSPWTTPCSARGSKAACRVRSFRSSIAVVQRDAVDVLLGAIGQAVDGGDSAVVPRPLASPGSKFRHRQDSFAVISVLSWNACVDPPPVVPA